MNDVDFTSDNFLGGRLVLKQPKKGYRVTSDSVYLAAAIAVNKGQTVLDVGAGTGAILSCLAARLQTEADNIVMHGIEIQPELLSFAKENAENNAFNSMINYFPGDIFTDVEGCNPNSYDHVVSNPPYYEKGSVTVSPYKTKAVAHGNDMLDLKNWIKRCMRMVKPKGHLTIVHRVDHMDEIITALGNSFGSIIIFPFYSKYGKEANRVIIRAQKDGKGLLSLKSGLIVHKSDGNYTDDAENILRHAQYLNISE